jgi:hypothetical protein
MKVLSLFAITIVLVFSVGLALLLAITNPEQTTLLIGFSEIKTTNGQLLVYAFAFGAAIGLMAMLVSFLTSQVKVGFLQYRLEKLQSELDSITANGLRENI